MRSLSILAGEGKGRALVGPPKGIDSRAATSRLRASLFEILTPRLQDRKVLDLFAGVGTLGLEALSRGASSVVFVEQDRRLVRLLRSNLSALGWEEKAQVYCRDAFDLVRSPFPHGSQDLVLVDPPYRYLEIPRLRRKVETLGHDLISNGILEDGGLVVIKHPTGLGFDALAPRVSLQDRRRYGSTEISIYHA